MYVFGWVVSCAVVVRRKCRNCVIRSGVSFRRHKSRWCCTVHKRTQLTVAKWKGGKMWSGVARKDNNLSLRGYSTFQRFDEGRVGRTRKLISLKIFIVQVGKWWCWMFILQTHISSLMPRHSNMSLTPLCRMRVFEAGHACHVNSSCKFRHITRCRVQYNPSAWIGLHAEGCRVVINCVLSLQKCKINGGTTTKRAQLGVA